ncbi:MAG: nuclear transport factor 2 family protein [Acidobacteriota bacterium]
MTNTEQIEYSVACFQQGDLEAVLGLMAENVDFRPSGPAELLPWARPRYGRAEVAQYFNDLLEAVDYESFEAEKFLADGDEVVVLGRARMRLKATDRVFDTDWTLRFELNDGQVVRYRDVWDTGAALEAFGLVRRGD